MASNGPRYAYGKEARPDYMVTNPVIVWNTVYRAGVIEQWQRDGYPVGRRPQAPLACPL